MPSSKKVVLILSRPRPYFFARNVCNVYKPFSLSHLTPTKHLIAAAGDYPGVQFFPGAEALARF